MTERVAYTLPEYLEAYNESRSSFYRAVQAGKLKAHKRGTSTIIFADDAEAYHASLPALQPKKAA